jgi:hypothetical protein
MKLIITQFVAYPEQDENTTGHSNSQSGNIDKRKSLMSGQVSESDL